MYTPAYHREENLDRIASFIRKYPFATLISNGSIRPLATHLPILVNYFPEKKTLIIESHMARANKHWQKAKDNESLLVFSEPHAYIPSSIHEDTHTVPTWNYIAVHIYGKVLLINDRDKVLNLMSRSVEYFGNKADWDNWKNMKSKKLEGLLKRVVAFDFKVIEVQARFKLSQEESQEDQKRIKSYLENSGNQLANFIDV